jgi:hypothetical protein
LATSLLRNRVLVTLRMAVGWRVKMTSWGHCWTVVDVGWAVAVVDVAAVGGGWDVGWLGCGRPAVWL